MIRGLRHVPGRVGHAYLLAGNVGLLDTANAFAKALNCLAGGEVACGTCISCRVFESGNHPDTFYVAATETKSIGVGDVRVQVIDEMATRPFSYRYKVFIIDKAETLTPAAQNALLKTIEEPAPFGVFLLLADKVESMLETVRSRCVVAKMDDISPVNEANTAEEPLMREVIDTAHTLDILGAMMLYKKFEPFKESKETAVALLDKLYERYGAILRSSPGYSGHAIRAARAITQTKEILSHNGNYQLAIELMLLKIGAHIA